MLEFKSQDNIIKIQEDEIRYYEKLDIKKDWDTHNAIHFIKRKLSYGAPEPLIENLNLNNLEIIENPP